MGRLVPGWALLLFRISFGLLSLDMAVQAGFLWQLNIALQAFNVPDRWHWIWVLLTLPQFCFAFCDAGRIWGLDAWLTPTLDRWAQASAGWASFLRLAT